MLPPTLDDAKHFTSIQPIYMMSLICSQVCAVCISYKICMLDGKEGTTVLQKVITLVGGGVMDVFVLMILFQLYRCHMGRLS